MDTERDQPPLITSEVTEALPEPEYSDVPAEGFRDPAGSGYVFASADGVAECRVRVAEAGADGECVSWSPGRQWESLIVFGEPGDSAEFSSDVSPALPERWGNSFPRLGVGEMIRLETVTCLSPAEGSIACFSALTGDGFRLTDDRYDTFHQGGERFGL